MKPKATGSFILVELPPVEEKSKGGIILTDDTSKREQRASEQGVVIDIGPCAYVGWSGCENPDIPAHKQWGIDIGDHVEFRKYEGKACVIEGYDRYRYIPDTHIVGRIDNE